MRNTDRFFQTDRCAIEIRRVEGPVARELFLALRPSNKNATAQQQAQAIYEALAQCLAAEGCDYASIVAETVFFRRIQSDLKHVRDARRAISGANGPRAAVTEIEQPPVAMHRRMEVLAHAIVPRGAFASEAIAAASTDCHCDECARLSARKLTIGPEVMLFAGNIFGAGAASYEQTLAMFEKAESILDKAGMSFHDVVRTWIHFADMERDYDGFNRARREFFMSRKIDPAPASTGIGAGLSSDQHDLCLGFYACVGAPSKTILTAPTLNEAPDYGSDFSRGMRVEEQNRTSLYVSGTASLNEAGATVHLGDVAKQTRRMLVNIAALLERQGACFDDIAYAITYIKDARDKAAVARRMSEMRYEGFPNLIVEAAVCRPELLCESEAVALAPR